MSYSLKPKQQNAKQKFVQTLKLLSELSVKKVRYELTRDKRVLHSEEYKTICNRMLKLHKVIKETKFNCNNYTNLL